MPAPLPVSGPDARAAAEQELRHAEYHRDDPSLATKALQWAGDRLAELLSGSTGSNALLVVLVLLALVVGYAVVRAGRGGRTARGAAGTADPLRPVAAVDHRAEARAHEAAGRLAEAVREWLRAAVATIEQRGVLTPRPGRTGAAIAAEAGPLLPDAAEVLAAAARAFDEIWFGGRAATDGDVGAAREAAAAAASARPVRAEPVAPSGLAAPW
ncbi:MAG: DUF4129 domain-containing protein [Jatrophihabitans sp.]|uniref:DUF4129 domain-containing protein n=1 Tax=Jatrophihabitans sp. TaxID=1932789 RepID=UPI003F7E08AB